MYKKIIVPVDVANAEKAATMLRAAQKIADDGAKIVLLSVVEAIPSYVEAQIPGGYEHKAEEYATEELQRIVKETGISADIDVRVGHASQGILDEANKLGADAIVIASHRPGFAQYLLGSTASRVVRHAPCTVVVIRE